MQGSRHLEVLHFEVFLGVDIGLVFVVGVFHSLVAVALSVSQASVVAMVPDR